jgi:hypothetical protein
MLAIFKGREAKLNHAILQTLAKESPQTIYEIHRNIAKARTLKTTRYANVNTRVRALEETSYVRKIGLRETKAGFKANLYEVTARAYFAILVSSLDLDALIKELDEISMLTILSAIVAR